MHQSFLNNGWQGIIWAMETENRSFSLTGRQLLELRTVRYLMLRGEAQWGNPGPRRPRAGFISPDITKKRSQASLMCVCVEIGEMFPDIFIKCQLLDYCLPLFETSMTLHCCFIGHISGSIFHPLLVFYISFLHSSFFLLVTLIEGLIDKEKIDF